jgi:integrase
VRDETIPAGQELTAGEIAALLAACEGDGGPAGPRDAALIGLLYGSGLRRAEVVSLDAGDYDPATSRLVAKGKGNKEMKRWVGLRLGGCRRRHRPWSALAPKESPFVALAPIREDADARLAAIRRSAYLQRITFLLTVDRGRVCQPSCIVSRSGHRLRSGCLAAAADQYTKDDRASQDKVFTVHRRPPQIPLFLP